MTNGTSGRAARWSGRWLAAACVPLLAGCAVMGPDFVRPEWNAPDSWFQSRRPDLAKVASNPASDPLRADWWDVFGDAKLTELARRAAAENLDVQIAAIRIEQARSGLAIAESATGPRVNAGGSFIRQRSSRYGILTANQPANSNANGTSGNGVTGSPTRRFDPYDIYQGGFDASWEIDLWGRVARSVEAAEAVAQSAEESRRGVLVSAIAEIARTYVQLRGTQSLLAIARDNLTTAQQSLALTQQRAAGGLTTDLDVANASGQVRRVAAEIPALQQREAALNNALALLLGKPPHGLRAELHTARPMLPLPARVPAGLPADIVRRRPDIREVEARLHAATAEIGVATAEFYPTVRLGGSAGIQALNFGELFNLAANTFALGPSITIPIFDGGRLKANLRLREASQKEAAIAFQKTVLMAWHEVDNALTAYQAEQARRDELAKAVGDSRRALGLARSRYEQGVADFLQVLDAQRLLLATQQQHQISATTAAENLVALYKALGGGWEPDFPDAPVAAK